MVRGTLKGHKKKIFMLYGKMVYCKKNLMADYNIYDVIIEQNFKNNTTYILSFYHIFFI